MSHAVGWDHTEDPPENVTDPLGIRDDLQRVHSERHDATGQEVKEERADLGHGI